MCTCAWESTPISADQARKTVKKQGLCGGISVPFVRSTRPCSTKLKTGSETFWDLYPQHSVLENVPDTRCECCSDLDRYHTPEH